MNVQVINTSIINFMPQLLIGILAAYVVIRSTTVQYNADREIFKTFINDIFNVGLGWTYILIQCIISPIFILYFLSRIVRKEGDKPHNQRYSMKAAILYISVFTMTGQVILRLILSLLFVIYKLVIKKSTLTTIEAHTLPPSYSFFGIIEMLTSITWLFVIEIHALSNGCVSHCSRITECPNIIVRIGLVLSFIFVGVFALLAGMYTYFMLLLSLAKVSMSIHQFIGIAVMSIGAGTLGGFATHLFFNNRRFYTAST